MVGHLLHRPVFRDMSGSLSFDIDAAHCARQLDLTADHRALAALGGRCADYLRLALGGHLDPRDAPRVFPAMLRPTRVPAERSVVLGLYTLPSAGASRPTRLVGVLYFLHPHRRGDTWFIPLLLLEPAARGRGLGAAGCRAVARWAAVRGAKRLVVAVADNNPRAGHFWRDRLGFRESRIPTPSPASEPGGCREMERYLTDLDLSVPAWSGQESHPKRG